MGCGFILYLDYLCDFYFDYHVGIGCCLPDDMYENSGFGLIFCVIIFCLIYILVILDERINIEYDYQ